MKLKTQLHQEQSINIPSYLKLSFYQKQLITKAIYKGLDISETKKEPLFTKKHHRPLEYDQVNEEIYQAVMEDKQNHHNSKFEIALGKAVSHEYVNLFDTSRSINIIICRLPLNQNNFDPSLYRGEHAYNNFNRLDEEEIEFESVMNEPFQTNLKFEGLSSPFGIIVYYDSINKRVFEGAQTPSQERWIYLDDISEIDQNVNIIPFTLPTLGDIDLPLKAFNDEDEEINIPLK
ncbi:hypothetical protein P9B03_09065 [Metasolibacillus meyeri]|uniref:Uncharacterized protein n=1 Tax=Metasolibacillus meyeri TaxID=1071052 RepID=A0AAW9NUU4_9BACL|nr:hypothetical protein [Metasolibacillus meyeri]MEC1178631.1 hypothetical protein [Metasolibacillus meyeri]